MHWAWWMFIGIAVGLICEIFERKLQKIIEILERIESQKESASNIHATDLLWRR